MKFFEIIFEVIGWIKIAISPVLIGTFAGGVIYLKCPTFTGVLLACIPALAGILIGIIWANKVWKTKEGTSYFVSRIHATPELDKKDEEK